MLNKRLLKATINTYCTMNDIKMDEYFKRVGISRTAHYRKISGKREYTRAELERMIDVLNIQQPAAFFFSKEVS